MEIILHTATLVKGINRELHTEIMPQNADENVYPVLKFKAFENDNRTATITIFPSFEQVKEMYEVLGEFLQAQKAEKENATMETLPELESKKEYLLCISDAQHMKNNDFSYNQYYFVEGYDRKNNIYEIYDDNGDVRYIELAKWPEFELVEK